MSKYIHTDSYLDKILAHKVTEVANAQARAPLATVRELSGRVSKPRDFRAALRREDKVALIAEIKKASPSRGVLIEDFDPLALARTYADNGAAAISVLTDEQFFQGHLHYLESVNQAVTIPTLRKDFIIDAYQIYEARMARADAVLLIVAALEDSQLADLHALALDLQMTPLVEVHNEHDLERALAVGAGVIGINNRNLKTFEVDLETTSRLATHIPDDVTVVAESGLKTGADVATMGKKGAHAVLIGEGLVTAEDTAAAVQMFSNQPQG